MAERLRVLLADKVPEAGLEPLRADDRFELIEAPDLSEAELAEALCAADAVIVRSTTTITRPALARTSRLRVIGRAGVGVDNIDVAAATEKGIAVLNAPSGNTISAAELTLALMLAAVRRVAAADRSMRRGEWDRKSFRGAELHGKTLGLVGAGRIGSEVAKRARAFGMRVIAADPYLTEERARGLELELRPLDDLLRESDVVSLHVPFTDSTAGLIGRDRLALLKQGAVLVNAARGGVVDEDALADALREGRLMAAGVDVYDEEPPPADHPLRGLDNVVLTPHLGAATQEAQHNVAREVAEAVRAALLEGDFSRAVNAPAVGGEAMRRLRPLIELAERLGRLASGLLVGSPRALEVRYAGDEEDALRPLVPAALTGVLTSVVGRGAVNLVNAEHLAQTRGLEVGRVRIGPHGDYAEYVELRLLGDDEVRVGGALLGEGYPRVVMINAFHVDVRPAGVLLVLRNRDVPGVIGRVGTLLGDAGINIGEYHQARLEAGGDALAAVSLDGRLSPEVLAALADLPEVLEVRQVEF